MTKFANPVPALVLVLSLILGSVPISAAGKPSDRPPLDRVLGRIDTQLIVRFKEGVGRSRVVARIASTGGEVRSGTGFYNTALASYSDLSGELQ